jgi:hypothetical protein
MAKKKEYADQESNQGLMHGKHEFYHCWKLVDNSEALKVKALT